MQRGDAVWLAVLGAITSMMLVPASHQVFITFTKAHPYGMGFAKFAVLATMGELLALRIGHGRWKKPPGVVWRAAIWGLIGILVVLMFEMFSSGVAGAAAKGLLWVGEAGVAKYMVPFLISFTMNTIFAPTFMIAHRITDTYIDLACGEGVPWRKITLGQVVAHIDWKGMICFVVLKTIPFFWIPAHTVVFLLPPEYRVLVAAYLAIALGAILSYGRKENSAPETATVCATR